MGESPFTAADPPAHGIVHRTVRTAVFRLHRTVEQWVQGWRQPRGLTLRELEKEMAKKREQLLLL
jgi:hypothetical protein